MWILEKYYHDFPVYNPALLNLPKSVLAKKVSGFKVYSLGEGERPCSPALSSVPGRAWYLLPVSLSLFPCFPRSLFFCHFPGLQVAACCPPTHAMVCYPPSPHSDFSAPRPWS